MIFKPEDFVHYDRNKCAEIANMKLERWLQRQQIVSGILDSQDGKFKFIDDPKVVSKTHEARVVHIRRIRR